MALRSDMAKIERRYLLDMLDVDDRIILEIGCGNGRLTWQYADRARYVVGIDVVLDKLNDGIKSRPAQLIKQVDLLMGSSIIMPFVDACFDHIIFAWSF